MEKMEICLKYEKLIEYLEDCVGVNPIKLSKDCFDIIIEITFDENVGILDYIDFIDRLVIIIESKLELSDDDGEKQQILNILNDTTVFLELGINELTLEDIRSDYVPINYPEAISHKSYKKSRKLTMEISKIKAL